MSDFKVPEGATHFVDETDDFRAHFIQVDEAANVLAEFVPSVNYIGWDFDIEPYPMLADSIPVSAYKELTTLRQQNAELVELAKYCAGFLGSSDALDSMALHSITHRAHELLSKIKGDKDAQ